MAEKRKLPPRAGREPAAKRRVSEAATPQSSKKKAPTPRAPTPAPPEPVEAPLPTKLKDGEGLPVTRVRQPSNLSDKDYQSIAESAVLLASLERSKKKWLSDGILVRYYTKPKKTKREQIVQNNPPKESMAKVGACDVTIGPHLFGAMIYTVKDPNAQSPIHYAPRPMVHYNHPNNFQQQRYQYQSPSNQQGRPPYSPAPARPPQSYPGNQPPHQQRGPQQPPSQPGQRPPQAQPGQQPAKPSPDPVIQMLATRAAADPELKALMRVVASSQASQEQLRAFQAHIDELNAIIKAREQQEQRQQSAAGTPAQTQPATPTPAGPAPPATQNKPNPPQPESQQKKDTDGKPPSQERGSTVQPAPQSETPSKEPQQQTASAQPKAPPAKPPSEGASQSEVQPQTPAQTQGNQPASQQTAAPVKQESTATGPTSQATPSTAPPPPTSAPSATPGPVATPVSSTGSQPSPAVRHPQPSGNVQQSTPRPGPPYPPPQQSPYGNQPLQSRPQHHGSPAPYYRPAAPLPPQVRNYKAVVFEFTSPLTPYGSSTSGHAGSGDRYLFPEYTILEWLPAENTMLASFLVVRKVDPNTPFPLEPAGETTTSRGKGKGASKSKKGDAKGKNKDSPGPQTPNQATGTVSVVIPQKPEIAKQNGTASDTPGTPSEPAAPAAPAANLKEYWQPVTWRIHATNPRVLEPLTRVVKPADEVRKYMNEVMDRAERAPDGFPALRLPREEAREAFESEGTPASATNATAASRSRPSRLREESEVESNVVDLEEDDELLEFYGSPSGLPPSVKVCGC